MQPGHDGETGLQPLHEILRRGREAILQRWESLNRRTLAVAWALTSEQLRNNVPDILNELADQYEGSLNTSRYEPYPVA
ncbi:hypothetical protein DYI22_13625 [Marinobacter lipolyticus]|nr:hypothetical protein [Marinobacter lipolyticus]